MQQKPLQRIKHGDKVIEALEQGALFYQELTKQTSLDTKTLQRAMNQLQKHQYIIKDAQGRWLKL